MMFSTQSPYRNRCSLLSILCRKVSYDDDDKKKKQMVAEDQHRFPIPELTSSGRLEVNVVSDPDPQGFRRALETVEPNFLYLQGFHHKDSEEIGPLVWKNVDLSGPEALCSLFSSKLPTTVYLEIPDGEELAEALHSKGIPYVIYWKGAASRYAAAHFRQALLSVVQSSCSHTWDTFQLAQASYRLYCAHNDNVALSPDCENPSSSLSGPQLLGDPPTIDIVQPEADAEGEEESPENLSSVKIYDDDVSLRFLVCGMAHTLDGRFLRSLEDGVNALLRIEIRGSKLHNRVSAPPPPLQAGTFSRGVVTMRCDFSTCTAAHISLLVSGNAQTCFNDQLLENHVKNELIENNRPAHALPSCEESNPSSFEPRKSAAIACGASVFEVCMKLPAWASQILKQLAPDVSYRSLVMLGIGSIQGVPVASFEKDDAERLLFLSARQGGGGIHDSDNVISTTPPIWLKPPPPSSRKRSEPCQDSKPSTSSMSQNGSSKKRRLNSAAMRPIPHVGPHRMLLPFKRLSEIERHEAGPVKANHSTVSVKQNSSATAPVLHRKSSNSSSLQAQQIIALNPLPLKKHGCGRAPIQSCSEEEFLRDVMEFLILRGHSRLVPQGGLPEFPDAVLNTKRLDLFNLYREVVTRGGFNVGNGINWKGQVFSKMRNYTLTNRMTGVGNTLKRHYETYLLEYELAHDDVGGECCLLCHSSAAGDWVNCGICGEWAHFGCDRRQGLGAFKDYAKTDGLEYICPHCSMSNFRKKSQKTSNGY